MERDGSDSSVQAYDNSGKSTENNSAPLFSSVNKSSSSSTVTLLQQNCILVTSRGSRVLVAVMSGTFDNLDVGAVSASLALLLLYHLNLYLINPKCFGGKVPFGVNLKNASIWIRKHKEMSESPVVLLAVQTLRNTMMAGVFIGGHAIVLAYNFANNYPNEEGMRMKVRSIVITILMFASFLAWANVIRLCSVLGYMIGTIQYSERLRKEAIEQEKAEFDVSEATKAAEALASSSNQHAHSEERSSGLTTPNKRKPLFKSKYEDLDVSNHGEDKIERHKYVSSKIPDIFAEAELMIRMTTVFFSFGFRLIFVSIPFAFYSIGPLALVIATASLLAFLWCYDHVRHGSYDPSML
jgi:uncharacterized membrane protein